MTQQKRSWDDITICTTQRQRSQCADSGIEGCGRSHGDWIRLFAAFLIEQSLKCWFASVQNASLDVAP